MKFRLSTLTTFLILLIILSAPLAAQDFLKGRVLSSTGLPVSGAHITLVHQELSARSDDQGYFSLEVPAGERRLKVRVQHPDYFEQDFLVSRPLGSETVS
ncbi:MAG: carboxypeptidase-like regulatory domain-containing protein, partial [Candidatus Saccharicenans sp.]